MAKTISLQEFGMQYFDKRTATRGNRNPVRMREYRGSPKKARAKMKEDIKKGKFDNLLCVCGISGLKGNYGTTIVPATVRLSKQDGFDTYKTLIHSSLVTGDRHEERTILSVKPTGMRATIKIAQLGRDISPYVHIYKAT